MKYRTCDDRIECVTSPGSRYKIEYESFYDKEGNLCLKEVGKHDLYLDIQADALSCDINVLIARYKAGDNEALDRVRGLYTDIVNMPDNFVDAYNMIRSAEGHFEALDPFIKQQFDNSFEKFLFSLGTEEWNKKIGVVSQKQVDVKEEETDAE